MKKNIKKGLVYFLAVTSFQGLATAKIAGTDAVQNVNFTETTYFKNNPTNILDKTMFHGDKVSVRKVLKDLVAGDYVYSLDLKAQSLEKGAYLEVIIDQFKPLRIDLSKNLQLVSSIEINGRNGIDYSRIIVRSIGKTYIYSLTANLEEQGLPLPPLPPPPVVYPPQPPEPPPIVYPPAPVEQVHGRFQTLTSDGEVFGWGCDINTQQPLHLEVYVNAVLRFSMSADDYIDDYRMGSPIGSQCNNGTGFKGVIPNLDSYAGSYVNVEVKGISFVTGQKISLGTQSTFISVQILSRGLFHIGPDQYFSDGHTSYCHIPTTDQFNLYRKAYGASRSVKNLPTKMSNGGSCVELKIPISIFQVSGNNITVYFSDGQSVCGVQHNGMLKHIRAIRGLGDTDHYQNLPSNMPSSQLCQAQGAFHIAGSDAIYYSNGVNAYCQYSSPEQIGGQRVWEYESIPNGISNHGVCQ